MKKLIFITLLAQHLIHSSLVIAEENKPYTEISAGHYFSSLSGESNSNADIFSHYSLNDNYGLFGFAYHDSDFTALYAGITRQFGKLEVGLGGGHARYSQKSRLVVHPWFYYEDERNSVYLYTEYIPSDDEEPFFYKFDAKRNFGDNFFAGIYAEKFFGVGPLVGIKLSENIEFQAAFPVADRDDYTRMNSYVSLTISF